MRQDLGDFQTPPELADAIVRRLGSVGARWSRVLEPTCGTGSFLRALLKAEHQPREMIGIEIQKTYCDAARTLCNGAKDLRVNVLRASLFDLDLRKELPWRTTGPLLVVGNPPWVTSATLGKLESTNTPVKRNIKGLKGLDAKTGSSNFDIAEAVWLKLLSELADQQPTIALLCKTAVARAVLEQSRRLGLPIASAAVFEINAARWFGAAVAACLLMVTLGDAPNENPIPVYASLDERAPRRSMGFHQGLLAAESNVFSQYSFALGTCPLAWRQGVKHDAANIMELVQKVERDGAGWFNKLGQEVKVEPEYVYPLVKGSDLRKPRSARPRRALIVTQERIGQETSALEHRAPRLWAYLSEHRDHFQGRKSSIYHGQPRVRSLRNRSLQLRALQGGSLGTPPPRAVSGPRPARQADR